jgi:peptide/bleomycin uptake transporter
MFSSFFPRPKLLSITAVIWIALSIALWYGFVRDLGPSLSPGGLIGFGYPPSLFESSDPAQRAAYAAELNVAVDV